MYPCNEAHAHIRCANRFRPTHGWANRTIRVLIKSPHIELERYHMQVFRRSPPIGGVNKEADMIKRRCQRPCKIGPLESNWEMRALARQQNVVQSDQGPPHTAFSPHAHGISSTKTPGMNQRSTPQRKESSKIRVGVDDVTGVSSKRSMLP